MSGKLVNSKGSVWMRVLSSFLLMVISAWPFALLDHVNLWVLLGLVLVSLIFFSWLAELLFRGISAEALSRGRFTLLTWLFGNSGIAQLRIFIPLAAVVALFSVLLFFAKGSWAAAVLVGIGWALMFLDRKLRSLRQSKLASAD